MTAPWSHFTILLPDLMITKRRAGCRLLPTCTSLKRGSGFICKWIHRYQMILAYFYSGMPPFKIRHIHQSDRDKLSCKASDRLWRRGSFDNSGSYTDVSSDEFSLSLDDSCTDLPIWINLALSYEVLPLSEECGSRNGRGFFTPDTGFNQLSPTANCWLRSLWTLWCICHSGPWSRHRSTLCTSLTHAAVHVGGCHQSPWSDMVFLYQT